MIDGSALLVFLGSVCFVASWVFLVAEAIGIVKLRNIYSRMLISSLVDSAAILLVLTGLILHGGLQTSSRKILVLLLFLLVVNPVTSHLIARSARRNGIGLSEKKEDFDA